MEQLELETKYINEYIYSRGEGGVETCLFSVVYKQPSICGAYIT